MSQLKYLCYSLHLQRTHILQFLCSIYCYHRLPTTKRQEMIQTDWWRWIWFSLEKLLTSTYPSIFLEKYDEFWHIEAEIFFFDSSCKSKKHPHHGFKFCNHQQTLPQYSNKNRFPNFPSYSSCSLKQSPSLQNNLSCCMYNIVSLDPRTWSPLTQVRLCPTKIWCPTKLLMNITMSHSGREIVLQWGILVFLCHLVTPPNKHSWR